MALVALVALVAGACHSTSTATASTPPDLPLPCVLGAECSCPQSAPSDASCTCVWSQCSVRPSSTPIRTGACQTDADCGWAPTTGHCAPGVTRMGGPIDIEGPHCRCENEACQLDWFAPVSCETDADCGVSPDRPLRPAPAEPKRTKAFKPCVDGEVDSVCRPYGETKACQIMAYAC